jgi:hypothetical protein
MNKVVELAVEEGASVIELGILPPRINRPSAEPEMRLRELRTELARVIERFEFMVPELPRKQKRMHRRLKSLLDSSETLERKWLEYQAIVRGRL